MRLAVIQRNARISWTDTAPTAQTVHMANMQTLEEALRLAEAAGIAEETMVEIASTSTGDSWAVRNVFAMREMMQKHPQGVVGARQIGVKDLSLAAKMARQLELDAPIAEFFAGRPWG